MKNSRRYHGNTLALTVAAGIVVFSIAVFIMFYVQTLGTHKQAQNAIDAAALQAAKDIGEIYIDTNEGSHFGPVGVSDNMPPGNDTNKRPIVGINTLMATIRLDALIAEQLGSSTMLVLAREDYEKARATSYKLQQKILKACNGQIVKDRSGHDINIQENATRVYDANPVKLSKGKRSGPVAIHPGILKPGTTLASSGTPIPQPANLARLNATQKYNMNGIDYYVAGVEIKENFANDAGNDWTFEFIPLSAQSASLIDPALWTPITSSDYLVPTVVSVDVNHEVIAIADARSEEEKEKEKIQKLHTSATAICASYGVLPSTDGALKVSFPQTKPPSGYNIDFTSVQSIMTSGGSGGKTNQIMLKKLAADPSFNTVHTAKDLGTASNYLGTAGGGKGWNDENHGHYATAVGGAFPDQPGSSLGAPKHFHSRTEDNASVVLSFLVYDWLKYMYLKPNISEVVSELQTPFTSFSVATSIKGGHFPQPAYAEINTKYPVTFALCDLPRNGQGDPRNWDNYSKDPEGFRRQFANVFGYVAADITLPNSSLVVSIDNNHVVTTNGQPPDTLTDLFKALHNMNSLSADTLKISQEIQQKKLEEISKTEKFIVDNVDQKTGQPLDPAKIPALQTAARQHEAAVMTYGRALVVMQNAKFGLQLSYSLLNDRKMLTSFGVTKVSDRTFELMPGYLYIPTRAATEQEILATGKISTGQDAAAGVCDWAALPAEDEKDDKNQLQFFVSTKNSVIGHSERSFNLLAPAFAASSIPPKDDNIYSFVLQPNGEIKGTHQKGVTAGVNLLEGQVGYQNTQSIITDAGNCIDLEWNCVARDNVTNVSGAYYRNMAAPITNVLPGHSDKPIACEWTVRCPAPVESPGCSDKGPCDPETFKSITAWDNTKLNNIRPVVDAAGNVRYLLKHANVEREIQFFDSYDRWTGAWNKVREEKGIAVQLQASTHASLKMDRNILNPVVLSQFYRAANGYTSGNLQREVMEDPYSPASIKYFEIFSKGMANLNINSDYLKHFNTQAADYNIDSNLLTLLQSMVYNSYVFKTIDEDGCPHLYAWAS